MVLKMRSPKLSTTNSGVKVIPAKRGGSEPYRIRRFSNTDPGLDISALEAAAATISGMRIHQYRTEPILKSEFEISIFLDSFAQYFDSK